MRIYQTMLSTLTLTTLVFSGCRNVSNASDIAASEPLTATAAPAAVVPAGPAVCIFGESLEDLTTAEDFRRIERGNTKRKAPSGDKKARTYAVTDYRRVSTGDRYTLFIADGDETHGPSGWIESSSAQVVAEVIEGALKSCTLVAPKSTLANDDCLFGDDLANLLDTGIFSVKTEPDTTKPSPVARAKGTQTLFVRDLKHAPSNAGFKLFAVKDSSELNGLSTGWIENLQGSVVAQFGVGEIYGCKVSRSGLPKVSNDEGSCGFGADIQDLDESSEFVAVAKTEVERTSRIAGDDTAVHKFVKRTLKHEESGQLFNVFEQETGEDAAAAGWIEGEKGDIVAEITDAGFRHCRF